MTRTSRFGGSFCRGSDNFGGSFGGELTVMAVFSLLLCGSQIIYQIPFSPYRCAILCDRFRGVVEEDV